MEEGENRALNILVLASWYPNKERPTLGNFVEKHAVAAALYNNVSVIAFFPQEANAYTLESKEENGVKSYIGYYPKITTKIPLLKQFIQWRRTRKAFQLAYRAYAKTGTRPDLIHINIVYPIGFFALKLKKKYGVPLLITENSTIYHEELTPEKPISFRLSVHVCKKADMIIPVSTDLVNAMRSHGIQTPMRKIPNVVSEKIFGEPTIIHPKTPTLLHVSTANDDQKNLTGIIRSVAKLNQETEDFHFRIISDGELEEFKTLAYQKLKLPKERILFEGAKNTEGIAQAMNESTAFVLFSNYENLPCVILESLVMGKPIISTDVNGVPEVVDESNGILLKPKDEQALVEAMLSVVRGEVIFNNENIRSAAIHKFSYVAIGKKFTEYYLEALHARRK